MKNPIVRGVLTATRCVVLIPHATPTPMEDERVHPLTEKAVKMTRRAKRGYSKLITKLQPHFGEPAVMCGQYPASIMTAVNMGGCTFGTTELLDVGHSKSVTRRRAHEFAHKIRDAKMVVGYGSAEVIRKLTSAHQANEEACRDLKPGIEAAVLFIDRHGKIISAHKEMLLAA